MHEFLDLKRYPLDKPGSETWCALVERCRQDLERDGMFNLNEFMRPDVARAEAGHFAPRFAKESFLHAREHNIYFKKSLAGLPDDHPALTRFQTSNNTICGDQIDGSAVLKLYQWQPFIDFLAATMDKPALYQMDDQMSRLNVMSYNEGQALNWHFDRSEFTTTLLLQAPEIGGEFEYRTGLRNDEDPNYDGVGRMLIGQDDQVQRMYVVPGTVNVFRGKNTAHRVTAVKGQTPRIIAVLSYYENPGARFSDEERIGFFGRAS